MPPSKCSAGDQRLASHHERLYRALNIATRNHERNGWEWISTDIEIQRNVVRSISSFLECVSRENRFHSLVKDSMSDIIGALKWMLKHSSKPIADISMNAISILLERVPYSVVQPHMLMLVDPLLCNLSSLEDDSSSMLCGKALNVILSNIRARDENEVWKMLHENDIAPQILNYLCRGFACADYFKEMITLLGIILHKWPSSRYAVASKYRLMDFMHALNEKNENALSIAVLKFYGGLVLCKNGAKRVLESGEQFLPLIVQYMGKSFSNSVRVEGFRLARSLVRTKQEWSIVMTHSRDPFLGSIIDAMSEPYSNLNEDLLSEASQAALVLRFDGSHHDFFWKRGIDAVLLTLLFGVANQHQSSLNEKIIMAKKHLKETHTLDLWLNLLQIIGWLATHCTQNLTSKQEHAVDFIIIFVCLMFLESYLERKTTARVALMCIHSPNKHISSKSHIIFSEILQSPKVERVVYKLNSVYQSTDALMELAVYSALPHYKDLIIIHKGVEILSNIISLCLNTNSETQANASDKTCCFDGEVWEGENPIILYCLIALSELLSSPKWNASSKTTLIKTLEEICRGKYSSGAKWYSSYILISFGVHGFPSNLGNDIIKALHMEDFSDLTITIPEKLSFPVHGVVIASQCPLMLQHEDFMSSKRISLSSQVDSDSLMKLLEFLYSGVINTQSIPSKKLKALAKRCSLHPISLILSHYFPKWGATWPNYTLITSFDSASFSDIILEANSSKSKWVSCEICDLEAPHVHAHKIVLVSRCTYLRGLLTSGMEESQCGRVKVPVSFEAMTKLVKWIYSDEMEKPRGGCVWENMGLEEKKEAVEPYVELGWLGEFWVMEEVRDVCTGLVISWVHTCQELALFILKRAIGFSLMEAAEVAACYLAPYFQQLRQSDVDDDLLEMIRCASVELSLVN